VLALEVYPEYDCRACTAVQKLSRGCETDRAVPLEVGGMTLLRCPRRPLLDDPNFYSEVFWLYRSWKDGHLPEGSATGVHGQPNKMLMAYRVMDNAKHDAFSAKATRQAAKHAAQAAAGLT
jgi:hypothetical protein